MLPPPSRPTLDPASDSGVPGDNYTNQARPLLRGTGIAGSALTLWNSTYSPPVACGSTTVGPDSRYTITPNTDLAGIVRLFATQGDSTGSTQLILVIDRRAPATPPVPVLTGNVLSGTTEGFATATIYVDGAPVGTAPTGYAGTWTFTLGTLSPGTHNVTVTATDLAGNVSQPSPALVVTIGPPSETVPGAPSLTGRASAVTLGWGTPADGGSAITGYVVRRDGAVIASLPGLSYTDTPPAGQHQYTVAAVNAVGEGPQSNPVTVTT